MADTVQLVDLSVSLTWRDWWTGHRLSASPRGMTERGDVVKMLQYRKKHGCAGSALEVVIAM